MKFVKIHDKRRLFTTMEENLETDRLVLRRPRMDDVEFFYELENDSQVYRYLPPGRPFDRKTVIERLQKNVDEERNHQPFGIWVAESKIDHNFIGWGLLMNVATNDYRLGYVVRKRYWGQGYATEVAQAIAQVGMKNGLQIIYAITDQENIASSNVLKKVGFIFKELVDGETSEVKLNLYQLNCAEKK